jgi:excinuclease ABC subunit C
MSSNTPNNLTVDQRDLIPKSFGIYKFLSTDGITLYIGKANDLHSRVGSYFSDKHQDRPHIISLIPLIAKIQYIETDNEIEALVLESALIHKSQPKYNIDKKDDKTYGWIYISTREDIPKVKIVRSIDLNDYKKGRLFGPYPSGRATRQIFDYIRKLYPFCTCTSKKPKKSCLYIDIGLCPGPHQGLISKEDYRENINEIIKFLTGNKKRHVNSLTKKMKVYAKDRKFEQAAVLRDKINDLKYLATPISVNHSTSESDFIESKKKVRLKELNSIAKELGVKLPERIECYDISNIQGKYAYGSMVVSINGILQPNQYRIFKIKGKDTPDDFGMLDEVLKRRLKHIGTDPKNESLKDKPNVVLIDGGKGQLGAVRGGLPVDIDLVGISKGKALKRKGLRKKDEFWVQRGPVTLSVQISSPKILIELRDEAHRFAIRHHRKARQKGGVKSILDDIKGIGSVRKKALKKKFGTVSDMRKASLEELEEVINNKGVSEVLFKTLKKSSSIRKS